MKAKGVHPIPDIMIPLVGSVKELEHQTNLVPFPPSLSSLLSDSHGSTLHPPAAPLRVLLALLFRSAFPASLHRRLPLACLVFVGLGGDVGASGAGAGDGAEGLRGARGQGRLPVPAPAPTTTIRLLLLSLTH